MDMKSFVEKGRNDIAKLDLHELKNIGLDRTLKTYYLLGPYPPLLAMNSFDEKLVEKSLESIIQPVDLYIHFPFCRVKGDFECSFCHFYKETYVEEREEEYLNACMKEIMIYKGKLGKIKVRSIYFGGGSFSLIKPKNLEKLLNFLNNQLEIDFTGEIKFEIHADGAKDKKHLKGLLDVLKSFGNVKIVIDIQTFNEDSLKSIAWSRVKKQDYFDTLEFCKSQNFKTFVSGLILGLPFETVESLLKNVLTLAASGDIQSINLFPLMFTKGDFAEKQYRILPEIRQFQVYVANS